jgi:hypothetical protein
MIIKIQSTVSIADIKKQFSEAYPFLKLEFFRSPHEESEPTSKKSMITTNPVIGEISKISKDGLLETIPSMTVHDLESTFRDEYGLFVQVFRSSGKVWLETSSTDNMTLKEQNELGKEKSFPVKPADLTDIDYD